MQLMFFCIQPQTLREEMGLLKLRRVTSAGTPDRGKAVAGLPLPLSLLPALENEPVWSVMAYVAGGLTSLFLMRHRLVVAGVKSFIEAAHNLRQAGYC